jgi:hypothetical protein
VAPGVIDTLLGSDEPSIRWKIRVSVLSEDPGSRSLRLLRGRIRRSPRVRALLDGHEALRPGTYAKWQGGHWVVLALAELGYPPGDEDLEPLAQSVAKTWLSAHYFQEYVPSGPQHHRAAVPVVNGRSRRCGSQQGGALLALNSLGLGRAAADRLVERLLHWQWPDGGWNCDRNPDAASSSAYETLLPMRALGLHARSRKDPAAGAAADRAAEVLLDRRVVFRRSTGRPIHSDWLKLHYPVYWRYDVLAALKGLAEVGHIRDPRCSEALDLLESKQLPDGGWPAEARYYRGVGERRASFEHVDWGRVDRKRLNEWVTADALAVLTAAGRHSA